MDSVKQFLTSNHIEYTLHEHPAVYTVEEAEKYRGDIKGLACKNLFLRDQKKRRFFLLVLPAKKQTDLKKFSRAGDTGKLSFASKELLFEKLGLDPGAVSPFGLINDRTHEVEVFVDKEVYDADSVGFHPNINTATLELTGEMFRKYLSILRHEIRVIEL